MFAIFYSVIKHERGQNFDFENVETMADERFGEQIILIYNIQDDIGVRREWSIPQLIYKVNCFSSDGRIILVL